MIVISGGSLCLGIERGEMEFCSSNALKEK